MFLKNLTVKKYSKVSDQNFANEIWNELKNNFLKNNNQIEIKVRKNVVPQFLKNPPKKRFKINKIRNSFQTQFFLWKNNLQNHVRFNHDNY